MIDEIYKHFENEYPREGCGVIIEGDKFIPCKNIAEDNYTFKFCPDEYINLVMRYKIKAIVHDHVEASNTPSQIDLDNCKALNLPYYIFTYPDMSLNIVDPKEL